MDPQKPYNPSEIEAKWQQFWEKNPLHRPAQKDKYYILDMFPYPSGDGLHVGHVENFTATDIYARFKRFQDYSVLHPMGWDAFGLPAENFAIKTGIPPQQKTRESIENFRRQIKSVGLSYDWDREINTSDPGYYRFTQWLFLFLYKQGLAYKKLAAVNWCPKDQTVLANEQVVNGHCERCGTEVIQKQLNQWFFRITDFVEDTQTEKGEGVKGLLSGLATVDWPASTVAAQKNWIGRSEGAEAAFYIAGTEEEIRVFTTRLDTLFGCTYVVVSPEHPLIEHQKASIKNKKEVQAYLETAGKKSDLERTDLAKEKTGVCIEGLEAVHPITGAKLPIYVADYVLGSYGTGAVMGVPAHDERDFAFAKKYDLSVKTVIEECVITEGEREDAVRPEEETEDRQNVAVAVYDPKQDAFLAISWKNFDMRGVVTGGIEEGESVEEAARKEVLEETGYKNLNLVSLPESIKHTKFYHRGKRVNRHAIWHFAIFELVDDEREAIRAEDEAQHEVVWVKKSEAGDYFTVAEARWAVDLFLDQTEHAVTGDGILVDSEEYSGLSSADAREKIAAFLESEGHGGNAVRYRLRDWLVSRQRYWGAPIPILYCDECGMQPVPEEDLPVLLPTDVDFRPTGESPLGLSKTFQNAHCPECGGPARREVDTLDTFVCSSWYYLRFADPHNERVFASQEALKSLLPVDFYMGGAEHTVLHLLYSRFITKVLRRAGLLEFDEPFRKLRHQGMIVALDGRKMSKSFGNVVNPDEMVAEFGADALRLYEMFLGPIEDSKPWNTESIVGTRRFVEKVWKLSERVREGGDENTALQVLLQKTIKKVTEDISDFHFNTAVSSLMILVNEMEKKPDVSQEIFRTFLILLSPFAPHIAEELWEGLGNKESIFLADWPKYDASKIQEEIVTIVVQVNGKVRAQFEASPDVSREALEEAALRQPKIQALLGGNAPRKVIVVPGKLVSLVV